MYRTDPRNTIERTTEKSCACYGVYGVAAQPRNAEEGLHDQSPQKKGGYDHDYPVRMGIIPFFSTCRNITVVSERPLARAVRT